MDCATSLAASVPSRLLGLSALRRLSTSAWNFTVKGLVVLDREISGSPVLVPVVMFLGGASLRAVDAETERGSDPSEPGRGCRDYVHLQMNVFGMVGSGYHELPWRRRSSLNLPV